MTEVRQGDIWWMESPTGKRRPVLVVSRSDVIPFLNNVVVAPITSAIRSIPTCVEVGRDDGLDHDSVASFDNLSSVPKLVLSRRIGELGLGGSDRICDALEALADC